MIFKTVFVKPVFKPSYLKRFWIMLGNTAQTRQVENEKAYTLAKLLTKFLA